MIIKYCLLVRACDNREAFEALAPLVKKSLEENSFVVSKCDHNPPCRKLTREEHTDLAIGFTEWKEPHDPARSRG